MRKNKANIGRTSPLKPISTVQPRETSDVPVQRVREEKAITTASTNVMLSGAQAKLMQPGTNDINMEHVEALKTTIRNGELEVDTGKIVDSLVREAQSYLQSK